MSEHIFELLAAGESQTLEIKETAQDPLLLARLICAFANSDGGKILVGLKEYGSEVVGVEEESLRIIYEKALQKLTPQVETTIAFIDVRILYKVAIIEIAPSQEIVLADGGAYVRTGSKIQPMASNQMLTRLPAAPSPEYMKTLTHSIESQTKIIESLHEKIDEANSWQAKWKGYLVSGSVGFIFSMLLAFIVG